MNADHPLHNVAAITPRATAQSGASSSSGVAPSSVAAPRLAECEASAIVLPGF